MIYTFLRLTNYIGIYNGIGLNEIEIDFSKCKSKIVRIIGDNGSGKSTLINALTPLPDDNLSFIPGTTASKQIRLVDDFTGETYDISFIHPVNDKGERETTKGYINKIHPNGSIQELNPTGKISTCRDLIYEELELDPNFIALTKMNTSDKGLAGKTPAERKKYVNNIVEETQAFTDIYKKFLKKSNFYKETIKRLSSKIDSIGNLEALTLSMEQVSGIIIKSENLIEKLTSEISMDKARISQIDPGIDVLGIKQERDSLEIQRKSIVNRYGNISVEDTQDKLDNLEYEYNRAVNDIDTHSKKIDNMIAEKEQESIRLQDKQTKLAAYETDDYFAIIEERDAIISKINDYRYQVFRLGLSPDNMVSKEQYITALDTITKVKNYISNFYEVNNISDTDLEYACKCIRDHSAISTLIKGYTNCLDSYNNKIMKVSIEISRIECQIEAYKFNHNRPKECMNIECPFMNKILDIDTTGISIPNTEEEYLNACAELETQKKNSKFLTSEREHTIEQLKICESANSLIELTDKIFILVGACRSTFEKLGITDLLVDEAQFMKDIYYHKTYKYIDDIEQKMVDSNVIDLYNFELENLKNNEARLKSYETKEALLNEVQQDIEYLMKSISEKVSQIQVIMEFLTIDKQRCKDYSSDIDKAKIELQEAKAKVDIDTRIKECDDKLNAARDNLTILEECNARILENEKKLATAKQYLENQRSQQNEIAFNIKTLNQYLKEMEDLKANYYKIDIIRKHTNPSQGGIQNLFVAMYMNKIIVEANAILSSLFDGALMLQTFIINESEFRIPVSVSGGFPHDDINSLSAGQSSLINMVISFALVKQSSSKYNVLTADELDGPLDPKNRRHFLTAVNDVMNLVNARQSIMISHNSEISNSECDIILLKNENADGPNVGDCNVIWSYYNQV